MDFRWHKKTVSQRRKLILDAWANMPKDHRPDAEEHWTSILRHVRGSIPDVFVWPFINQEDLVMPTTLMVFLNARGRMPPWEFAAIEMEFSPVLTVLFQGCADEDLCTSLTIDFTEAVDQRVYGKLNRNSESSADSRKSSDKYSLCARRAFQSLLMQQRILSFLLACAKAILHEKTLTELFDSPVQDIPPIIQTVETTETKHASFTEVLNVAPYRGWNSLNLSQLRGYVESTYCKHRTHFLALREDPGYFADTFREDLNHCPTNVPSDCCNHLSKRHDVPQYMTAMVIKMLHESYTMLDSWKFLKERLNTAESLGKQGATKQDQARPLLEFRSMLRRIGNLLLRTITRTYRSTPGCRLLFKKKCKAGTYHRVRGITAEQRVFLDLMESIHLAENEEDDEQIEWPTLLSYSLEQVDSLLKRSETARRMITGRLLDLLTDLSIITECARQISLWAQSPDVETGKVNECTCKNPTEDGEVFYRWQEALGKGFKPSLESILPLKDKLDYPEHKRRTRNTVTVMYNAEQNLDSFWSTVDAHLEAETGLAHRVIQECLQDSAEMYRTAPWDDSTEQVVKLDKKLEQEFRLFSDLLHNKASQITGAFDRLSVTEKAKPKTRGAAQPSIEQSAIQPMYRPSTSTERTFNVKKDDYRVFKALFHVPANESGEIPKCVKWNSFKRAMVHIGFSAESLQGSAWQFIPTTDVEAQRGIQFHEPHPENEIPYVMAKRFGRRLGRVYGWTGDTFQLA
ncbi:hypothetical protein C7974DRAFT_215121 [Boeremia exigua]|uniref:uncharacterized protein n=1 Tax=Boeremia exigua TaxID=749465 RepID=UPI001E8CE839|nr:uncharacterized protein C7974DRAFT_215121 [Boeremia exigua]KAH6622033.1 hypothetical protein C7974DRAFT_215121 [Boeremia exigua]